MRRRRRLCLIFLLIAAFAPALPFFLSVYTWDSEFDGPIPIDQRILRQERALHEPILDVPPPPANPLPPPAEKKQTYSSTVRNVIIGKKGGRFGALLAGPKAGPEFDVGLCYGLCGPNKTVSQVDYVAMCVQQRAARPKPVTEDNVRPVQQPRRNPDWVITSVSISELGTQPKLMLRLTTAQGVNRTAVFKPKYYGQHWTTDDACKSFDRHQAELAAYYLRRSMRDFVRTSRVIGVRLDLERDVWPVRDARLKRNTWIGKDGRYCVRLKCTYCKDFVVCGGDRKTIIEGSISFWSTKQLMNLENPWGSTCTEKGLELWRSLPTLCRKMMRDKFYGHWDTLLDAIDGSIFDFLIDNPDRHHFQYWINNSSGVVQRNFILLDNGKAFSHPDHDDLGILAALFQCCMIRERTYIILRQFSDPSVLVPAFKASMASDPIYPFLDNSHTGAVARRLAKVIAVIEQCIDKYGVEGVVSTDPT